MCDINRSRIDGDDRTLNFGYNSVCKFSVGLIFGHVQDGKPIFLHIKAYKGNR